MFRRSVPNVWTEMERLQREMNHLFRSSGSARLNTAPSFPAMNIWASDEGQMITAEIPGVEPDDLEISVTGEILTLSGLRKPDLDGEETRYHRQERGYGRFKRSIQLPYPVDAGKIEANFKNGILKVSLPRSEDDKPRKISVKTI